MTEVTAGTQKILWPAGSDIRRKLPHRLHAHSRRRPLFDGPHPLPAVKRDIASAEDPGRNHPFVQTILFDGDPTPLLRTKILSPSRAAAPVLNYRDYDLRADGWALGGHRPRCRPESRRQTSKRSGPVVPAGPRIRAATVRTVVGLRRDGPPTVTVDPFRPEPVAARPLVPDQGVDGLSRRARL